MSSRNTWVSEFIRKHTVNPELVFEAAAERGLKVTGATTPRKLESLARNNRTALDGLADEFISTATLRSAVRGFLTGIGGPATMIFALPIEAQQTGVVAIRMASAVMNAYGFETQTDRGQDDLLIALAVGFGVDTITVAGSTYFLARYAAAEAGEQITAKLLPQVAVPAIAKTLAPKFAVQQGSRGLGRFLPFVGAPIGAAINWGTTRTLGRRVKTRYQSRHSTRRNGSDDA